MQKKVFSFFKRFFSTVIVVNPYRNLFCNTSLLIKPAIKEYLLSALTFAFFQKSCTMRAVILIIYSMFFKIDGNIPIDNLIATVGTDKNIRPNSVINFAISIGF